MHIVQPKCLKFDQNTSRRHKNQHTTQQNTLHGSVGFVRPWVALFCWIPLFRSCVEFRCSFDSVFPLGYVVHLVPLVPLLRWAPLGFAVPLVPLVSAVPLFYDGSVVFRCSVRQLCFRCSSRINQSQPVTTATQHNAIQQNN